MIYNKQGITVPGRRLAVIKVYIEIDEAMDGQIFEVKPNFLLTNEHPNYTKSHGRNKNVYP